MKTQTPQTTFERKEIKYILTPVQKSAFMFAVKDYLHPDENGESGNYQLMSLYFDSPNKDFYWSKWFHHPCRKKVRIRKYVQEAGTLEYPEMVFIEVKEHTETINYKRRVLLSIDQAFKLLAGEQLEKKFAEEDQIIVDEILGLAREFSLVPTAITAYERQAYKVKKKDGGIRVTFDQGVRFRTDDLKLEWRGEKDKMLIEDGLEVMEIKVKGELPNRCQEALNACGIEQVSFSKYAHAVEMGCGEELVPPIEMMAYGALFDEHKEGLVSREMWKDRKLRTA